MSLEPEIQPCDLYVYCCQRHAIRPNSKIFEELRSKCCNTALCSTKQELNFASNYVGCKGIVPLLDTIQYDKELYKINFSHNRLQYAEVTELVKRVHSHPCLCSLDLSHNHLNDSCTNDLVKFIRNNTALTEVKLTGNDFCSFSLKKIETELVANKHNTFEANCNFTTSKNIDHDDGTEKHDGVLMSERKCLKNLQLIKAINECTSADKNSLTSAILQNHVNHSVSFPQHSAKVNDYMSEEESGGCLQYSSWRSNHQYVLAINHKSMVKIEMQMHQTSLARVAGFAVMRSNGVQRIIEISSTTVIAESTMSNVECDVVLELEAGRYVIVPYTFYPSRSLSFTLSATLVNLPLTNVPHHTLQQYSSSPLPSSSPEICQRESIWITLEKLNKDYDWCSYTYTGVWNKAETYIPEIEREVNKSSLNVRDNTKQNVQFTWLHNDMYLVQCNAARSALITHTCKKLPMSLYVVLTKSNDSDDNDERWIGADVIKPVPHTHTLPPLEPHTETTVLSVACAQETEICFKLDINALQEGAFIVPTSSTEVDLREVEYTLTLYSALPLEVTPSSFPHGWHCTTIDGCWSAQSCGGCREINGSWKNNPTIEVTMMMEEEEEEEEEEKMKLHNAECVTDQSETSIYAGSNSINSNKNDNKKQLHLVKPSTDNVLVAILEVDWTDYATETKCRDMHNRDKNISRASIKNYANCKYDTQTNSQRESVNSALCIVKENMKRFYTNVNDTFFNDLQTIDKNSVETEMYIRPSLIAISTIPPLYKCIESTNEPLITITPTTTTNTKSLVKTSRCESACLFIHNVNKPIYLMPFTRQAGMMGKYKLHIFASCAFSIGNNVPLALRERNTILRFANSIESELDNGAYNRRMEHEKVIYSDIHFVPHAQEFMSLFHDREFPNAASSIWLDPLTQPVQRTIETNIANWNANCDDNNNITSITATKGTKKGMPMCVFPSVYAWKRISERFNDATVSFLCNNTCSQPILQNDDRSWFASALYAVASKPSWLHRLCVLYEPNIGKAVFQFYKQHTWRDVVVDDYLLFDAANQFIMGYSVNESDVFYPLIEKAYAKLHRCYEALERKVSIHSTLLHDFAYALTDLTGGVMDVIDLQHVIPQAKANVEQTLQEEQECNNTHNALIQNDKPTSAVHELSVKECHILPPHSTPLYHEALNVCNMMSNCVQTTTCLWRRLCEAMRHDTLICAVRSSTSSSIRQDGHACVGLLANQLYAIVDAQFAHSHRLLLLRNWCDGVHTHWAGQWSNTNNDTNSNNNKCKWTNELKSMVHYDEESVQSGMTFWMSFDELLHYFTHLFITRIPRYTHNMDGILTSFVSNEPSLDEFYTFVTEHNFPQYALTIDLPTETCSHAEYECKSANTLTSTSCNSVRNDDESVSDFIYQVVIGIHQADVRMSLTRTADATVQPVGKLGLMVLEVEDNTQRLSGNISTNKHSCVINKTGSYENNGNGKSVKLVGYIDPSVARDRYCALSVVSNTTHKGQTCESNFNSCSIKHELTPHDKAHKNYILVPFSVQDKFSAIKEHPFQLTVQSSNHYLIHLHEIAPDNLCSSIDGEWNESSSGGPPTSLLWRDNPQFVFYPRKCARFKLELIVHDNNKATTNAETCEFGFTVHDSRTNVNLLDYDANFVIASGSTQEKSHSTISTCSNVVIDNYSVNENNKCRMISLVVVVTLNGIQERKGAPYVIVPYCTNPNYIGSFTLRATSNVESKWNAVHSICEKFYRLHKIISIGQEYHDNLQRLQFNSWWCHPQFTLRLPYGTDGVIRVVAMAHKSTQNYSDGNNNENRNDIDTSKYNGKLAIKQIIMKHKQENVNNNNNNSRNEKFIQDKPCRVGCVLLRSNYNDNNNNKNKQNLHLYRQLCSEAFNEVIQEETSDLGEVQLCVDLAEVEQNARQVEQKKTTTEKDHREFNLRDNNSSSNANNNIYTLIPYVDGKANVETILDLYVYGFIPVELNSVKEWPFVKVMHGSWELGVNSGGCREWNASWVNNPFYGIATVRNTNVIIKLIVYPRSAHKHNNNSNTRAIKQCNSAEMVFPSVFTKRDSNTNQNSSALAIQLDLFSNDDLMTPLCHTSSSSSSPSETALEEVNLSAHLTACDERPFVVVPCTLESEQDADFKLFVYADQPTELYKIDKPRVAYAELDKNNALYLKEKTKLSERNLELMKFATKFNVQ